MVQALECYSYRVGITFKVSGVVISGLRYIHIVKRAGIRGMASGNVVT